jgi:HK97 gp10 family phage protein
MASITLNIAGMDKALSKFDKFKKVVQDEIKDEVAASALKIQSNAKKLAPVYMGTLRNSIYLDSENVSQVDFNYTVGVSVKYAPYVEFGTGGKVSIPSGYESYASQFKKKTGSPFKAMVLAIMEWGLKNGYIKSGKGAKEHAYYMALKILKRGLRAQPFLIPAFEQEKPKLKSRIMKIIKNAKS